MKKLLITLVAIAFVAGFATTAKAMDGDFEISGHINTGVGLQMFSKSPFSALGGGLNQEGMLPYDFAPNLSAAKAGQLLHKFDVAFYVGDVELDIAKTFGENIRLRVDLDFFQAQNASFDANSIWGGNLIEQAYATINIPVGYGLEFMVGRFNAPMGFEAVDNNDNDLPLHTTIFNWLRPQNLTGAKFYYPFSDMVDLHFWLANNLRDVLPAGNGPAAFNPSMIPAVGLRLGLTWGMEGQESTVGLSGAFSMESKVANVSDKWGEMSYLGDLDFNIWVNDVFAIGGEALLRRDGAVARNVAGVGPTATDNYYIAGLLNLHYVFSDVWDGTLRYSYTLDKAGSLGTPLFGGKGFATVNFAGAASQYKVFGAGASAGFAEHQQHDIDLGINYHITDGAKIMTMYRFAYVIPSKFGANTRSYANANKTGMAHTLAANFAYEF